MPFEWPENANQVGSNLFRQIVNRDQGKHPDSGRIGGKHDKVWTGQGGELLDEYGFTRDGTLPDGYISPQYQMLSERQSARRNDRLAREAQLVLDQGLSAMGQYRPGVSQQLTSGLYGQQANAILENRMGAPDLMHYGRQDAVMDAQKHATKMGLINAGAGIISAGLSAGIGAIAGGGGGLNISPSLGYNVNQAGEQGAPNVNNTTGQPTTPGTDSQTPGAQTQTPAGGAPQGGVNVAGGPAGGAPTPGGGGQGGGGQGAGGAGGPMGAGPTTQGGQGAGPGSAGGGGDFGPQSMGGGGALGGGDPSMMAGGGMGGGDSVFQTPVAAATTGMSPVQALSMGTGMNPNDLLDLTLEAEPDLLAEDFNDQAYARVGFLISSDIPYNPLFSV